MTETQTEIESKSESESETTLLRPGAGQALGACVVGGLVTVAVSVMSWEDPIAPRLVIVSFVVFAVALLIGSTRIVGITSVGVLGAALISSAIAASSTWVESIVIGCGWYVAVELAWDSIERRDGASRSSGYNLRRIQEVSTVVVICLGVAWVAFLATALGPSRSLVGRGILLGLGLAGLALAIAHVSATAPKPAGDQ